MSDMPLPPFVIAVPVLNEEQYIRPCLESLRRDLTDRCLAILVLDGGSKDRTAAIVQAMHAEDARIQLVANPGRSQAAAINLAARIAPAAATVLLRADAHTIYEPGFAEGCVRALRDHAATSVVVPMRTVGQSGFQRAVAAAQNTRLGNGGSAHRGAGRSGPIDHGHHAAFDRAFFRSLGGYDESFTHNEDAELDHRALRAGGLVWMSADHPVRYFPRKTIGALARQYARHGAGRARTMMLHRMRPKPRQLAPVFLLAGVVGGILLGLAFRPLLLGPLAYAALCCGWGVRRAIAERDPALLAMGPAAMTMHLAWACGFLRVMLRPASWHALRGRSAAMAGQSA